VDSTPAQSGGSSTGSRPKKIAMNQTENSTVCTIFTTSMKQGSKYGEVSKLQEKLNTLGFNSGIADGLFGPKTNLAVKAFQTVKKLASDGIVGPMTRGVLNDCK
jgi:peptidoglycan hydrolase-like protein with peptidoglycan-binding domain